MAGVSLIELVRAAARIEKLWEASGFEFCFIGGLALQYWGEPRQTNDVDASLWTEFGNERPVIDHLLESFSPRIEDAASFAMMNRVLLVQEPGGIDTDIALAAFPFERDVIERATPQTLVDGEPPVRICDASDLVVLKAFANRPRDWPDIRGILVRSGEKLNWDRILAETKVLAELKAEPEIMDQLKNLRQQVDPDR